MLNESFELNANGNTIQIKIKACLAPNYGKELWIADLIINNEVCNHYFANNNNKLNFNISKVDFTDAANNYVFVPAEKDMFVINSSNLTYFLMPQVNFKTGQFMGNIFLNNKLAIIFTEYVFVYNLNKQQYDNYIFETHKIFSFKKTDNNLVLTSINNNTKEVEMQHIALN